MELRLLRSFILVAQEKSFTRAAQKLNIAQPPLSNRIRELERQLGVRLFDRSTRSVTLTEPGRVYLEQIKPLLEGLEEAAQACLRAQRGEAGRLRLGYTGRASHAHLPMLLSRFRESHPQVSLDIQGPSPTGALHAALLERKLDAILCFLPLTGPDIATSLLTESQFAIVLPAAHRYAASTELSLSDLHSENFIAYPSGRGFHLRDTTDKICADAGFSPRVVRETDATQTLLCLIAAGVGVGIMPEETEMLSMEGIVFKDLPDTTRRLQHGLAWLKKNENPILARLLDIVEVQRPR